jgi:prephenate dehydrogenase
MFAVRRLCIIGVGLIGGSLARALRHRGACHDIVGVGRTVASLEKAVALGVIDRYALDPATGVDGADMVVLATPLGAMAGVLQGMREALAADAIVTDVGSAKRSVVEAVYLALGHVPPWFVPGHPIAGAEHSGVEHSFAELFEYHRVILTPLAETDPAALTRVRAMWELTGAEVVDMDVAHHDRVLAATSHLPHVLAFALVDSLARRSENEAIFRYAAGGFRDFTRIASGDPVMWRDICLANRDAVIEVLASFSADLAGLGAAIERGDGEAIIEVFRRAKSARDTHLVGRVPRR